MSVINPMLFVILSFENELFLNSFCFCGVNVDIHECMCNIVQACLYLYKCIYIFIIRIMNFILDFLMTLFEFQSAW